jgi:alkylated DNA repair dioxygenase AlkB
MHRERDLERGVAACMKQSDLFADALRLPEGFRYAPELVSPAEERRLVSELEALPFKEFEFHGFLGKRRVVSFGWRYDFTGGGLQKTDDMPAFLLPLRERAAAFAGLAAESLQQVLLTEYRPGAAIGWHKDRSVFGEVIGISLLSSWIFRLRRKAASGWERASLQLEPRSAYLLQGAARSDWEHSIPALEHLRYSITFRNILERPGRRRPSR